MIYEAINQAVLSCIPETTTHLLDIGCGSGALAKQIKSCHPSCKIVGITHSKEEANLASSYLDQIFILDLNNFNSCEIGQFDCIVCSHILEHLSDPEIFLSKLRQNLTFDGILIIALPNALHWKQRLEFLKGNFKYTEGGVMDKTHLRFFDWMTAFELVQKADFKITSRMADGYFPLPVIRKVFPIVASSIDRFATKCSPGLFGVQFIIIARKE